MAETPRPDGPGDAMPGSMPTINPSALAAGTGAPPAPLHPHQYDVVIVGAGGAGAPRWSLPSAHAPLS